MTSTILNPNNFTRKEEKLNIGRRLYEGELTRYQAAEEYDIGENTAHSYMRMYRDLNQLPPKEKGLSTSKSPGLHSSQNLEAYQAMTKEELIQALVKARIAEARLKKGYEVKGDGSIIRYSSRNTK